jgi:hypothetical protein
VEILVATAEAAAAAAVVAVVVSSQQSHPTPRTGYAISLISLKHFKLLLLLSSSLSSSSQGCSVVSTADPYGHNLAFIDQSCYFVLQVVQLYSRG